MKTMADSVLRDAYLTTCLSLLVRFSVYLAARFQIASETKLDPLADKCDLVAGMGMFLVGRRGLNKKMEK